MNYQESPLKKDFSILKFRLFWGRNFIFFLIFIAFSASSILRGEEAENVDHLFISETSEDSNDLTELSETETIWVAPSEETVNHQTLNVEKAQETEKTQAILDVDDIRQFSEELPRGKKQTETASDEGTMEDDSFSEREDWKKRMIEASNQEIDPKLALFQDFTPTAEWAEAVEGGIRESFSLLESDPEAARKTLRQLSALIVRNDLTTQSLLTEEEKENLGDREKWIDKLRLGETGFSMAGGSGKYGRSLFPNGIGGSRQKSSDEEKSESEEDETVASDRKMSLVDYSLVERKEILQALRYRLDRRVFLWGVAAKYFEDVAAGRLQPGRDLTKSEILSLKEKTKAVRNYFGISAIGRRWRKNFEIDSLYEVLDRLDRQQADHGLFQPISSVLDNSEQEHLRPTGKESFQADMILLRDHINSICYKLHSTTMTPEQQRIFENPILSGWIAELAPFACDQTDPYKLLGLFDRYEREGGGETGKELGKTAYRMKTSRSESCRQLGNAVNVIFNNPNVKIYVSQAFINRFLPIRDPEFDVIQERILGNPVAGSRRTDTQVRIQLVPDSERLLMNLVVTGRIIASTQSDVFPAKVFNESYANYAGSKLIEWKDNGIVWSESRVDVKNTNQLSDVKTNIDFVPIVGSLAREMVKGEYQSRQEEIRQETRQRIVQEVTRRIDSETTERFQNVNGRLTNKFFAYLDSLGMTLTMQNSKTTEDWLLASLRLAEPGSLGSQTTEPPTLAGAFADLKIHESAINTALARLDLAGRDFTPSELTEHLAKILNRPEIKKQDFGDVDLILGMGQDPVSVSFDEGQIRIRLRFDFIEMGRQSWDNIVVDVVYQPLLDKSGNPVLARSGVVSVSGPMNIRAQIPLRTLFSKVFTAEGRIPLRPKLFDQDERFAGLSTGLCRVTNGWFAVSVVEPETVSGDSYPRLKTLREKVAHRPRILPGDKIEIPPRQAFYPVPSLR